MDKPPVFLAIPAGLLYVAGLLFVITAVLARVGGWHRLAQRFRVAELPNGETLRMQSATLGMFTNYNNVLTVVVTPEGFAMRPFLPFSLQHPPLFIPFTAVARMEPWKMLWATGVSLEVEGVRIRLYRSAGAAVQRAFDASRGLG